MMAQAVPDTHPDMHPDTDPDVDPDTFHEALHPAFVTSAAVTPEIIDDFLHRAAANYRTVFADDSEGHAFSLQRAYADAAREMARIERQGWPLRGTRPPVGAHPDVLDFAGATVDALARYVLRHFAAAADEVADPADDVDAPSPRPRLDDRYFVVLDERSARDRSVLVVAIPCPDRTERTATTRRTWTPRDDYTDRKIWQQASRGGGGGGGSGDDEMMAVRIAFEEGFHIDMMRLGEGAIWELAEAADAHGVYSEASKQALIAASHRRIETARRNTQPPVRHDDDGRPDTGSDAAHTPGAT